MRHHSHRECGVGRGEGVCGCGVEGEGVDVVCGNSIFTCVM